MNKLKINTLFAGWIVFCGFVFGMSMCGCHKYGKVRYSPTVERQTGCHLVRCTPVQKDGTYICRCEETGTKYKMRAGKIIGVIK